MKELNKFRSLFMIFGAWVSPRQAGAEARGAARFFSLFMMIATAMFGFLFVWHAIERIQDRQGRPLSNRFEPPEIVAATSLTDERFENRTKYQVTGIAQLAEAKVVLVDHLSDDRRALPQLMVPLTDVDWGPGDPIQTFIVFDQTSFDPARTKDSITETELQMVSALGIDKIRFAQWEIRFLKPLDPPMIETMEVNEVAIDAKQALISWHSETFDRMRDAGFDVNGSEQIVALRIDDADYSMLWLKRLQAKYGSIHLNIAAISLFMALIFLLLWRRVQEPVGD